MLRKALVITLVIMEVAFLPRAWAQRGSWDGFTTMNMKARYSGEQIGGYLLHQCASLLREVAHVMPRIHTSWQRNDLAKVLTRISRKTEELSLIMKEKELTQKDVQEFQKAIARARKGIRKIAREGGKTH